MLGCFGNMHTIYTQQITSRHLAVHTRSKTKHTRASHARIQALGHFSNLKMQIRDKNAWRKSNLAPQKHSKVDNGFLYRGDHNSLSLAILYYYQTLHHELSIIPFEQTADCINSCQYGPKEGYVCM